MVFTRLNSQPLLISFWSESSSPTPKAPSTHGENHVPLSQDMNELGILGVVIHCHLFPNGEFTQEPFDL